MAKTAIEFLEKRASEAGVKFWDIAEKVVDKRTIYKWKKKNPKSIQAFIDLKRAIDKAVFEATTK